jgi:hypothetical protein
MGTMIGRTRKDGSKAFKRLSQPSFTGEADVRFALILAISTLLQQQTSKRTHTMSQKCHKRKSLVVRSTHRNSGGAECRDVGVQSRLIAE